jgi:CMP-N-acetylneuraminic acid synthetase
LTIGLISARGGSTRTPRKNTALVGGLPLVAWSIIQSQASHLIDETYLTTDDDEIADIGKQFGAIVIRRPVMDSAITVGVPFSMAVKEIEATGVQIDSIMTLLPTSPLREPDELDRMIEYHRIVKAPVTVAVPQKETYIFKLNEPFQDRFATLDGKRCFEAHQLLGDKFWQYARLAGGANVAERNYLMDSWISNPARDYDIDIRPVDTEREWHFLPVPEWEAFEVDYPEDLEIVRLMFDHYLPRGIRHFVEYGEAK